LQRALAAARAGVIDVLLVCRVDRLTRGLRDLVALLNDLDWASAWPAVVPPRSALMRG
jgi:site-specific DNA recombinase